MVRNETVRLGKYVWVTVSGACRPIQVNQQPTLDSSTDLCFWNILDVGEHFFWETDTAVC